MTVRKVSAGVLPFETIASSLDRLIAAAPDAETKEESMWVAGETYLEWDYFGESAPLNERPWQPDRSPPWYQKLVKDFPRSPLQPLAQWRVAECARRHSSSSSALAEYGRVAAPKGTFLWAWKNLREGQISGAGKAAARFREVGNEMPSSPEKVFALMSLGNCCEQLGETAEAIRAYQAVQVLPEVNWNPWGARIVHDWVPRGASGEPGNSHYHAGEALRRLGSGK
jgi:tetratricopeptide (TPR) repeat protein